MSLPLFKARPFAAALSCGVCAAALLAARASAEESPAGRPTAVITAGGGVDSSDPTGSPTAPGNDAARAELLRYPGGVAVADAESFENSYAMNFEDTLAYIPGVYAQKRFGEEVRISLRGSGLSRGFHLRGLDLLQDGVPFNLADGSADFQEADPLAMQRIEVFKGANALQYGVATLGGAVNMVSKTGRSNPGREVRAEYGSFDTWRLHAQQGTAKEDGDAFVSVTGMRSGGYRGHDVQKNIKINANAAHRFSEHAETRFYVTGNVIQQELPGSVSLRSALDTPEAVSPSVIAADQQRDIRSLRLSNKTTFDVNNDLRAEAGAYVNLKDLFHPIAPFIGVVDQESADYGGYAQLKGEHGSAGGDKPRSRWRAGMTARLGTVDARLYDNIGGKRGALKSMGDQLSKNAALFGEHTLYLNSQWGLVTGAQLALSQRELNNDLNPAQSDEKTYRAFNPKLGLTWEPADNMMFFANLSGSYEPPTFSELTQGGAQGFTPVDAQRAKTAEIGARGAYGIVAWDLSLYRAELRDEMLQFTPGVGVPAATFNADKTVHQGAELGAQIAAGKNLFAEHDALTLKGAYTWSDYFFKNDPQYGDNRIAGQPEHFFQAEMRYTHPSGWYIAPNIELANGAEVDFSNTVQAPGYGISGLDAGWNINQSLVLYLDMRNLLDKRYVSTYSTTVNGAGEAFYPGEGRSVFAGVRYVF